MRAAILHAIGDLRIEQVPDPVCGPGEVVLRVEAGLTCGTDVKAFRRGHPTYARPPAVLGHEFAGTVESVGAGVAGFAVGDRVFCANSAPCGACFHCLRGELALCEDILFLSGGFAERILVPARIVAANLHRLPDALPFHVAAIAEPLACAMKAVAHADLHDRPEVLVLGSGALGLMLTGLLASAGARVTVLDPHADRLELARAFGADDARVATKGEADVELARALTNGGRGADHVFEAVGRVESWELAAEMARPGGTVHFFGGCSSASRFSARTFRVHYEEVRLQGTFHHHPEYVRGALRALERGARPWERLLGPEVRLDELPAVLAGDLHPEATKVVVRPWRRR